jgi:3D (Asp-Asp-Asp) domain-containing protein
MTSKQFLNHHLLLGISLILSGTILGTSPSLAALSQNNLPTKAASPPVDYLLASTSILTQSRFSEEVITKSHLLSFPTQYIDNSEKELGEEEVAQEGKNGEKRERIKITYFDSEEYDREIIETEITKPLEKIIVRGTKKVIRETDTPDGKIRYFRKLNVWATSYTGNCPGCSGRTFSGTEVKRGTIAIDPKVIPLGTKIYVPGYGFGVAEDTGGAIKGNKIDLGFEILSGQWSARWVEIYLLE